jgi:hypothetical protein
MSQVEQHTARTDKLLIYYIYLQSALPALVVPCPWPSRRVGRQHADEPGSATHGKLTSSSLAQSPVNKRKQMVTDTGNNIRYCKTL